MSDVNPKSGRGGRRSNAGAKKLPPGERKESVCIGVKRRHLALLPGILADLPVSDESHGRALGDLIARIAEGDLVVTRGGDDG